MNILYYRYFIIIDDIRRTSVWDIISRALPDDHCGSRIIITTESEHVASACSAYDLGSSTFKMDALNGCTDTITSEEKNEDINLRYNNLPLHLKTCLLYLSMYPEGWTIMKNGVIKQWVAEGFIAALERQDTEEISEIPQNKTEKMAEVAQDKRDDTSEILQDKGEEVAQVPQDQRENISEILQDQAEEIVQVNQDQKEEIARVYFDELVTRGMIQPVDINHKGELLSCTVHHMVLDLIWNKSKEDNFIVVVDNLESTLGHPDIVRRLSVQFGCEKAASIPESIILSQVRSLAFYGFLECVPSIADYALLRVLILNIWADEDMIFYLTGISELYHLTYLKIECNITVRLPSKIQRLKQLGTLELHAELVAIPSDIGHLKKLMHVCCPSNADVRELGNLTSLLDLQLNCTTIENLEEHMKLLRSTLEKLRSLRSLALVPASGSCNVNNLPANSSRMCMSCDSLCILAHVPAYLQRLELSCCCCIFSRPPKWVGELHQLCILKIAVRELYREDIDILKGLPALTTLSLHVQPMFAERIVFGKEGFSVLKYFKFTCTPWLIFKAGAMPNLQKLKLCFNSPIVDEQGTTRTIIIERLLGLKEISAIIGSAGVDIGSAWRKAIRNDPRNPKVQLVDSIYYGDQGRGMVTRDSGEDDNNEADLRIHMQPESSGLPITVRCKEEEPEDRTFISEIISILNESECSDEHAGQIFTESCRELIRRIQEDTSKQFKDEFAKELENMELTDDVVNYGDYKVEACVEQFTNLCEELKVFDLEYFYSSCGELQKQLTEHIVFHILTLEEERARKALEEQQVKSDQYIEELTRKLEQNKSIKEEMEGRVRILEPEKSNREKDAEQREKEEFEHLLQRFRTNQLERGRFKTLKLMPPSVGLVLLRRLRSFVSAFSPTSSVVHLGKPLDSSIICGGTEEAGTSSRRRTRSPLAPLAVAPSDPTTPPKQEKDEEAENTMSFDDVNALVLAERQRPQQTQEEVARSEVDARAEEFIPGFQEDLRQQRLHLQLHPDAQAPPR
nr:disease resistance protein RGA5-like [Lolium perenne]